MGVMRKLSIINGQTFLSKLCKKPPLTVWDVDKVSLYKLKIPANHYPCIFILSFALRFYCQGTDDISQLFFFHCFFLVA